MSSVVCGRWRQNKKNKCLNDGESANTQRIMGKKQWKHIISTDIIFYFFPSFLKGSGPRTQMSGLFFYLGLFMVADSSYIFYHLQLLTGRHRSSLSQDARLLLAHQHLPVSHNSDLWAPLPPPSPARTHSRDVVFHPRALIGVDRRLDKISPVTKQGLWNHSADWVCSAGWEDRVLTIIEFDRLMKQCSAGARMNAGVLGLRGCCLVEKSICNNSLEEETP